MAKPVTAEPKASKFILTIVHEIESTDMESLAETLDSMRGYGSAEIVSAVSPELNAKTDPSGTAAALLLEIVKGMSR
jgi:hypothetical protein